MAHIKAIRFSSVGRQEGCTCDRCGQYIQNIWTVEYTEGLTVNYGIDCFRKVKESGNLSLYGKKELTKIMKRIQNLTERLEEYTSGNKTAENDQSYINTQTEWNKQDYWYGKPFEEYKAWKVEEFYPYRISEAEKELAKFKKISFEA